MSRGGGGSTTTTATTVQRADPWSGQQPYLADLFANAKAQSQEPMSFFPGMTFAPTSPETESALGLQSMRAIAGSPLTAAGQGQLADTLSGAYLGAGNPYLSGMMARVADAVTPRVDARFASAGRYGSGHHARALSEALTEAASQLAFQNYGQERANQMRAMLFAPTSAQQDYFDIGKLAEVGGAREDMGQQAINEQIARYNFTQMAPWQQLGLYGGLIQGSFGGDTSGTTTTTMPGGRRTLGSDPSAGVDFGTTLSRLLPLLLSPSMGPLGLLF